MNVQVTYRKKEKMERLKKQIEFILEIDKLKGIIRQNYIGDGSRKESDTDHSWHLALMGFLLKEYANEKVDILKTVMMVLIHDLVEIDAGDTYAYDMDGNKDKRERELLAADRIFNLLPEDQGVYFRSLWNEFEEEKTPEGKFANTLDKIHPILLNDKSGGKSWKEHEIFYSQVLKRNENTANGSERLWEYAKSILEKNVIKGNLKKGEIT